MFSVLSHTQNNFWQDENILLLYLREMVAWLRWQCRWVLYFSISTRIFCQFIEIKPPIANWKEFKNIKIGWKNVVVDVDFPKKTSEKIFIKIRTEIKKEFLPISLNFVLLGHLPSNQTNFCFKLFRFSCRQTMSCTKSFFYHFCELNFLCD